MTEAFRRADGVALWRQVADALRDLLDSAGMEAGAKLPTEAELAIRFGVNRHTVRAAIADLSREGLVHSRQGRGTFVTVQNRLTYPISRKTRFTEGLEGQAHDLKTLLVKEAEEPADDRMSEVLRLSLATPLVRLETLSFADHIPISRATHWFEAARVPGIGGLLRATGSISKVLEAHAMGDYARLTTRITARRASAQDVEVLRLSERAPVLVVEAVNGLGDQPIQFSRTRFAADRIEFTVGM